jgi:glucose/mannose transport system permease protein
LLFEGAGLGFLATNWASDLVYHIPPDSTFGQLLVNTGLASLTSPRFGVTLAVLTVVVAAMWQLSGYTMALYLAGLRGISEDLREAARVDGATEWQIYRLIVIPLLKPITLSVIIILAHLSLKIYDLIVAMGGQGPGFVRDMPAVNMFDTTFGQSRFAQGAAISMVLLVLVSVLIVPYLTYTLRQEEER